MGVCYRSGLEFLLKGYFSHNLLVRIVESETLSLPDCHLFRPGISLGTTDHETSFLAQQCVNSLSCTLNMLCSSGRNENLSIGASVFWGCGDVKNTTDSFPQNWSIQSGESQRQRQNWATQELLLKIFQNYPYKGHLKTSLHPHLFCPELENRVRLDRARVPLLLTLI